MIVSASRRTDIPARYADWMMRRLRAGYVLARNPHNPAQVGRIPLTPDVVDGVVFWSKDPAPLLPYLDELDRMGHRYYFQFTLTPYGRQLEPGLRPKSEIFETFLRLSRRIGRGRTLWRYDPILLGTGWTVERHERAFAEMCRRLAPFTDRVTVSFLDLYAGVRAADIRPPGESEAAELAGFIGRTARGCGIRPVACCEKAELAAYGIGRAGCIDRELLGRLCGSPLAVGPDRNQRPGCGCAESVDIGAYRCCPNGCVYCYANSGAGAQAVRRNAARHRPDSEMLLGARRPGDRVRERPARSGLSRQLRWE